MDESPSTVCDELTFGIIHPRAPTVLAVHAKSPAFKVCHVDGVDCWVYRFVRKSN